MRALAIGVAVTMLAGCGQTKSDARGGGEAGSGPVPCVVDCPCPSSATVSQWLETPSAPGQITTDGSYYYVAVPGDWEGSNGEIRRYGLDGRLDTVLATGQRSPWRVSVLGDWVYFNLRGPDLNALSQVARVPLAGGEPELVADHRAQPNHLLADGTRLYWLETWPRGTPETPSLVAFDPSTESLTTLVAGAAQALALAQDDTALVLGTAGATESDPEGDVLLQPKSGGEATVLASLQGSASTVALDQGAVYWGAGYGPSGAGLFRVERSGGVSERLSETHPVGDIALVDGCVLYVDAGTLWGQPTDGRAARRIVELPADAGWNVFALDAVFVARQPTGQGGGYLRIETEL